MSQVLLNPQDTASIHKTIYMLHHTSKTLKFCKGCLNPLNLMYFNDLGQRTPPITSCVTFFLVMKDKLESQVSCQRRQRTLGQDFSLKFCLKRLNRMNKISVIG